MSENKQYIHLVYKSMLSFLSNKSISYLHILGYQYLSMRLFLMLTKLFRHAIKLAEQSGLLKHKFMLEEEVRPAALN